MKTTSTERMQKLRDEAKKQGLVRLEVRCKPEHREQIKRYANKLSGKGEK